MDPRIFAPWIRATNTNTLQMGAGGNMMHLQAVAFMGGRSPDPIQRIGLAPHNPFVVEPAQTGRSTIDVPPGAVRHTGLIPAPAVAYMPSSPSMGGFFGRQLV